MGEPDPAFEPAPSAGKVVLQADHDKIVNDVADASFVTAAVPSIPL